MLRVIRLLMRILIGSPRSRCVVKRLSRLLSMLRVLLLVRRRRISCGIDYDVIGKCMCFA